MKEKKNHLSVAAIKERRVGKGPESVMYSKESEIEKLQIVCKMTNFLLLLHFQLSRFSFKIKYCATIALINFTQ
jgi:hypothetical protein